MSVSKTSELENTFTSDNLEVKKTNKKSTKTISQENKQAELNITYDNFIFGKITLGTYKIPKLKEAAKIFKLRISGSKNTLITRITDYFAKTKYAISIQRTFRRHMVTWSFKLRGPSFHNKTIKCVNDTDFVTMEPLEDIPFENFYSYTDEKGFTYGFDVASLLKIIRKNSHNLHNLSNPYNREKFSDDIIENIKTLYKLSYILFETFRNENDAYNTPNRLYRGGTITRYNMNQLMEYNQITTSLLPRINTDDGQDDEVMPSVYRPRLIMNYTSNQDNYNRYNRIQIIRAKTVTQRINELFIEVDHLGNYTQSEWFSSLDSRCLHRMYRSLYDIWSFRSGLTMDVKMKICPFHGPFDGIFNRTPRSNELSIDQIRLSCLIAMENMIYSGIDEDHRKIGCFHALSALTIVSAGARNTMPWLYESVIF
jgi:hypothetical protein